MRTLFGLKQGQPYLARESGSIVHHEVVVVTAKADFATIVFPKTGQVCDLHPWADVEVQRDVIVFN